MNINEVVELAERVRNDLGRLRSKSTMAVMFVDLVGSTEFKARNPAEESWLPRLARFLLGVTRIVEVEGQVVKYIGDEVMATFREGDPILAAEHAAENILRFCEQLTDEHLSVKIALDYGDVSLLNFARGAEGAAPNKRSPLHEMDPQGLVVDRCARIMSKAKAGAVLCSAEFRSASRTPQRWKSAGEFHPRGFADRVEVFILDTRGAPELVVKDETMTLEQCAKELAKVQAQLEEARRMNRR